MMTIQHLIALLLASPEFMTLLAHGASAPVLLRAARELPPIAAETAQLSPGRMAFEIEVTLASGRVITPTALSTGTANILAQAAG